VVGFPGTPAPAAARSHRAALVLLAVVTLVHLFFAVRTGLEGDEAYYWQWSRHLAWGYYDHPPVVAYLIAAGTALLGPTALGVRLGTVVLATLTGWLIYRLGRGTWSSGAAGLWALTCAVVTPLFSAGALLATPDAPLVFFWTASVLLAVGAVKQPRSVSWVLLGATLGLGMLSKYTMVLLPAALLAAFLTTPEGRRSFTTPGPWLTMATALVVLTPHLVWQWHHGGGPVFYQLRHGLGAAAGSHKRITGLSTFFEFLGGQAGVVTPLLFALLGWALWVAARASEPRREPAPTPTSTLDPLTARLLLFPALFPLAVFGAASLLTRSEPNWAAPAYPTAFVLLGGLLAQRAGPTHSGLRTFARAAVALAAALTLFAHVELAFSLLPLRIAPARKIHDRSQLMHRVQELRDHLDPKARVLANNYRLASLLAFYLPDHPETDSPLETGSGSAYHAWRRPLSGPANAWYLTTDDDLGPAQNLFAQTRLVAVLPDRRQGVDFDPVRVYYGALNSAYPGPSTQVMP
jgi:dolichol-phosphate mannosyltransferase